MVGPGREPLMVITGISTPSGDAVPFSMLNQYSRVTPVSGTDSYQSVEISKPSLQHDRVEGEFTHAVVEFSDGTAAPNTLGKARSEVRIKD